MTDRSILRWCIGAGLVFCASCFDGRDALGLPCEQDFQCGNGQVCADGTCAWPGDVTGGGSASASSDASGSTTGGPGPVPTCVDGGVLTNREINISGSGNPMSVGAGRFSDEEGTDLVVLTRSPARLSVFRFGDGAFEFVDDVVVDDEPMDIAVGPLDDDEYDDVVVVDGSNSQTGAVTIFWGGAGGLSSGSQTSFDGPVPFPHSVAIGRMLDLDVPQLVVSSGTSENVSSLFSVPNRELERLFSYSPISASPWDTVLVDLNGKPPLEALVVGSNDAGLDLAGSDVVHVLGASDASGMTRLQPLDAAHSPFGVDAGDLDGDDIPDVIIVGKNIGMPAMVQEKSDNPSEISICSRKNLGDPLLCNTWQPEGGGTGYSNVRLADLNCDGELDAVIGTTGGTDPDDGQLLIAMGPLAPGFVPEELGTTGPIGNKLVIADVTGDGALDIVLPLYGAEGSRLGIVRVYSYEEPPE